MAGPVRRAPCEAVTVTVPMVLPPARGSTAGLRPWRRRGAGFTAPLPCDGSAVAVPVAVAVSAMAGPVAPGNGDWNVLPAVPGCGVARGQGRRGWAGDVTRTNRGRRRGSGAHDARRKRSRCRLSVPDVTAFAGADLALPERAGLKRAGDHHERLWEGRLNAGARRKYPHQNRRQAAPGRRGSGS